jgi:hypothetical protein
LSAGVDVSSTTFSAQQIHFVERISKNLALKLVLFNGTVQPQSSDESVIGNDHFLAFCNAMFPPSHVHHRLLCQRAMIGMQKLQT